MSQSNTSVELPPEAVEAAGEALFDHFSGTGSLSKLIPISTKEYYLKKYTAAAETCIKAFIEKLN